MSNWMQQYAVYAALQSAMQQQQAAHAADQRVRWALDQAQLRYRLNESGNHVVEFALGNGRTQVVVINSRTQMLADMEFREVYTPVLVIDRRMDGGVLYEMLRENGTKMVGAFEVARMGDREVLLFNAKVRADLSPPALRALLGSIAEIGDRWEQRFERPGERDKF